MRIFLINGLYLFGDNRAGVFRALASVDALFIFERKTKMKNKGLLYAIAASLVLSSMLTACADTEDSDTTASNTQAIASQTTVETDKATENATDAVTDTQETTAPETDKMTDVPATNSPVEDTKAPETQAPETDPPATKAPETQAPVDDKVYASKEEYPDDWGEENDMIRTDGKTFFWKKSRVMHTVPQGVPDARDWYIEFADEKNDQLFFVRRVISEDVWEYYSMVEGKFYKLNEGKVIFSWYDGTGPFYWIEEDGTAKSVNVRSKKYSEVYIEAEGVRAYGHRINSFETFDGKLVKPNSENILAKVKEIS